MTLRMALSLTDRAALALAAQHGTDVVYESDVDDARAVVAALAAPDGRVGCDYCAERLRVNVGLVAENAKLRKQLGLAAERGEAQ